jgi:hypothetical protein
VAATQKKLEDMNSQHWMNNASSPQSKAFVLQLLKNSEAGSLTETDLKEQRLRHFEQRSKSLLPPI